MHIYTPYVYTYHTCIQTDHTYIPYHIYISNIPDTDTIDTIDINAIHYVTLVYQLCPVVLKSFQANVKVDLET